VAHEDGKVVSYALAARTPPENISGTHFC